MNDKTIIITGGHLTPAVAVIDELVKQSPETLIIFAGRASALEGDSSPSPEKAAMEKRNIPFVPISTGRVTRSLSWKLFISLCKLPVGFIQSLRLVNRVKPDIIVSFGGYIALPVALAGWLKGVPVVTHEQTAVAGLTNRIIALFAKNVYVSTRESMRFFPKNKTIVTGLPIRPSVFHPPKHPSFDIDEKMPLLYFTGGATGAVSLNDIIFPIIPELVKYYMVVHQVGHPSLSKALEVISTLDNTGKSRYGIKEYIGEEDLSYLYRHATLIIGRSGANTVSEVAATGSVALFIPLPWAGANEQYINAKKLEDGGTSAILEQKSLTPALLLTTINAMVSGRKSFSEHAENFAKQYPRDAATKLARDILS